MKRVLRGLGIFGGLIVCQVVIGSLPAIGATFYVYVSRPLYQWLHLIR